MDIHDGIGEIVGLEISTAHGWLQEVSFASNGFVQVSRNHDSTASKDSPPSSTTEKQYGRITERPIGMGCLDNKPIVLWCIRKSRFPVGQNHPHIQRGESAFGF